MIADVRPEGSRATTDQRQAVGGNDRPLISLSSVELIGENTRTHSPAPVFANDARARRGRLGIDRQVVALTGRAGGC